MYRRERRSDSGCIEILQHGIVTKQSAVILRSTAFSIGNDSQELNLFLLWCCNYCDVIIFEEYGKRFTLNIIC